jgi:hypothetical protein
MPTASISILVTVSCSQAWPRWFHWILLSTLISWNVVSVVWLARQAHWLVFNDREKGHQPNASVLIQARWHFLQHKWIKMIALDDEVAIRYSSRGRETIVMNFSTQAQSHLSWYVRRWLGSRLWKQWLLWLFEIICGAFELCADQMGYLCIYNA